LTPNTTTNLFRVQQTFDTSSSALNIQETYLKDDPVSAIKKNDIGEATSTFDKPKKSKTEKKLGLLSSLIKLEPSPKSDDKAQ